MTRLPSHYELRGGIKGVRVDDYTGPPYDIKIPKGFSGKVFVIDEVKGDFSTYEFYNECLVRMEYSDNVDDELTT